MSKERKTEGIDWLINSLGAFNGSGYADTTNPELFLERYVSYKDMKNDQYAIEVVNEHRTEALDFLTSMLKRTYGAGRTPALKPMQKFDNYHAMRKQQERLL